MSSAATHAVQHCIPDGFEVDAAKALMGLFGAEIAIALKARYPHANPEPRTATATGPRPGGGAGATKSKTDLQPVAVSERAVRQFCPTDGRPGGGAVLALVRNAVSAAG